MDITMQEHRKDIAVVSLVHNCKSINEYYIRIDEKSDRVTSVVNRLRNQFDLEVELGLQITIEKEIENSFYHPAKREAENFVDYLKNVVATNYREDSLLGGWYEIKSLSNSKNWLANFKNYEIKRQDELMRSPGSGLQTAFF